MTKKIRLIILLVCVTCFLVGTLILVPYSMGYRFDFERMKVTTIGGIYIYTNPKAEKITIDDKIIKKPGILSNEMSFLNLLPRDHTVLIEKTGYYDYFKTVVVQEKEVTKLENILLIKKNIKFDIVEDDVISPFDVQEKYIIKDSNLYYSNALENSSLTVIQKSTPLIKKITAFYIKNNDITWLGTDGFIYESKINDSLTEPTKVTSTAIKIIKTGYYKIISNNNNAFVIANGDLLVLNSATKDLDIFEPSIKNAIISPNGKNIVYYDNNNIYISPLPNELKTKNILYASDEKIINLLWINSHYIIFTSGNNITITEIDYRGNVNSITLPQTITIPGTVLPNIEIEIKTPKISFDQQNGKLFILTGKTLLLSEKITP